MEKTTRFFTAKDVEQKGNQTFTIAPGQAQEFSITLEVPRVRKGRTTTEVAEREMAVAGILALQAGDNPRIVEQKLDTFLTPAERASIHDKRNEPGSSASAGAEAA